MQLRSLKEKKVLAYFRIEYRAIRGNLYIYMYIFSLIYTHMGGPQLGLRDAERRLNLE